MLFVDDRAGSKELAEPLRKLGVPVETTRLDFGDVMWEGRGVGGSPVLVGVEFKQLRELVQALRSERLQGYQLPGMRETYAHSYLFIEGELEYDRGGLLQVKQKSRFGRGTPMPGQMSVSELLKRIYVLHLCGGLNPWYTTCRKDTLQSLVALYHTWTDQDLDAHKSHLAIYEAPSLNIVRPNLVAKMAHAIDGIGWDKARKIGARFKTPADMLEATLKDWKAIEGIGDGLARKAMQALHDSP